MLWGLLRQMQARLCRVKADCLLCLCLVLVVLACWSTPPLYAIYE